VEIPKSSYHCIVAQLHHNIIAIIPGPNGTPFSKTKKKPKPTPTIKITKNYRLISSMVSSTRGLKVL